jgi:hypothetical protein
VLVVFPALVSMAAVVGRRWFPAYDYAFMARSIADVGGRHTPLVGVYSRFGWHQPGPLLFWVLAPFQWLFGDTGILVGAAVINAAALVGILVVARRRGGLAFMVWVAMFLAVLLHALTADLMADPWNPWLPLTGLVLVFMLAWSVACGDTALWPWLVGVATWVIQAHVGYAPLVVVLVAFSASCRLATLAGVVRTTAQPSAGPRARHGGRAALVVFVALWAPPALQQLIQHPGNLHAFLAWTLKRHQTLGLKTAIQITGKQLSLPPPWVNGRDSSFYGLLTAPFGAATVQLIACAALAALAWWRRQREAAVLAAMSLVAVGAGIVSIARVVGFPFTYLARYMWVIGMFVTLSTGWCLIRLVQPAVAVRRIPAAAAAAVGVALAATMALTASTTITTVTSPGWRTGWPVTGEGVWPAHSLSDGVQALVPQLQRFLVRDRTYLLVPAEANVLGAGLGVGLQSALEARGYRVYLPPVYALEDATWRTIRQHRSDATLTVVAAGPVTSSIVRADWTSVAHWYPPVRFSGWARYDVYLSHTR